MLLFLFGLAGIYAETSSLALVLPSILYTTVIFNILKNVPICHGMNCASPNLYVETLTPNISECDCIRDYLCRGNQVNMSH